MALSENEIWSLGITNTIFILFIISKVNLEKWE